jgi:hypothetical protein
MIKPSAPANRFMHVYEVRPRKDKRGFDLVSDALPFGVILHQPKCACELGILRCFKYYI